MHLRTSSVMKILGIFSSVLFFSLIYLVGCDERHNESSPEGLRAERCLRKSSPAVVHYHDGQNDHMRLDCRNGLVCELYRGRYRPLSELVAFLFDGNEFMLSELPLPRQPNHIWALYHDESPKNNIFLHHEKLLNIFNYSSTFSSQSDLPLPLYEVHSMEALTGIEYFVNTSEKNKYLSYHAPVVYIQAHCDDFSERDAYVRELMKYIPVDSYGPCTKNKVLSKDLSYNYLSKYNHADLKRLVAKYKFALAIENAVCEDYMSEKLWRPLRAGVVPLYLGATSVRDWLPNARASVLLADYPTPRLLSEYLYKLLADNTLYEQHLEHKTRGIVTNKKLLYQWNIAPTQHVIFFARFNFYCYLCQKLHDLKNNKYVRSQMSKRHYNCPTPPVTALRLRRNPAGLVAREYERSRQVVMRWVNNKFFKLLYM